MKICFYVSKNLERGFENVTIVAIVAIVANVTNVTIYYKNIILCFYIYYYYIYYYYIYSLFYTNYVDVIGS